MYLSLITAFAMPWGLQIPILPPAELQIRLNFLDISELFDTINLLEAIEKINYIVYLFIG